MMYGRGQSNLNHDFNAYDAAGLIWHIGSSTFVTEAVADYASYRIAATKNSDANDAAVQAPFTATAPTGTVRYVLRERGASLALSYEVWEGDVSNDAAAILAAWKADPQLGTADGGLVANAAASKKLAEADQIIENRGGVQVLAIYEHGTDTELLPPKAAKQPGGAPLTNPVTQQLAGYRE